MKSEKDESRKAQPEPWTAAGCRARQEAAAQPGDDDNENEITRQEPSLTRPLKGSISIYSKHSICRGLWSHGQ